MDMHEINALTSNARKAFAGLADAVNVAGNSMRIFGDEWYLTAERTYLKHHQKLPGGRSTERLQKKRRSAVLKWFKTHIEVAAATERFNASISHEPP